ncbi:MAG TPA: hypothetical protein VFW66_02545 [Gemmatimonadales bacterium]|nr:hypothetical protein [Gemmatimonadales bacterium]
MSLRSALLADWPLKLTSLVLSVMLWLAASGEEPASGLLSVEVRVHPPPGRTIVHPPDPLRATVVGPRRDLLKLSGGPLLLTRILPDTLTADSVQLEFAPLDLILPHGVSARVQDIEPHRETVELDPVAQRMVTVHPVVRLAADSGYELEGGVSVVPGEVRIAGSQDAVARIDSVVTLPLTPARAGGFTETRVAIDTGTLGGIRVFPSRVTVSLTVHATGTRALWPVPVQLASATADAWQLDRDLVVVRVHGPRGRLGALTPDSVVVTVEQPATGLVPGRAALRVVAPAGLTGTAAPESVTVAPRREGPRGEQGRAEHG